MQKEEEEEEEVEVEVVVVVVVVVVTIFSPTTAQRSVYELLHVCWYSDTLQAKWSEDQIPVGVKFSAPIQSGRGTHPAFYTRVLGLSRG